MISRKKCFERLDNNNTNKFTKCEENTKCSFHIKYDGNSCLPIEYLIKIVETYNRKNMKNNINYDEKNIKDKKYIVSLLEKNIGND